MLTNMYVEQWKINISAESKMRTYITFKTEFQYERYLDLLNTNIRKSITRLRISAHNLAIERGRYSKPPTPCHLRTCPSCPLSIQDELHFIFDCADYHHDRQTMMTKIIAECPIFQHLPKKDKLRYIMTSEGKVLQEFATFVHRHLP